MNRLLTTLLSLVFVLGMTAKPDLSSDKRYHIVCLLYTNGCVVDGASAGQNTPLYHVQSATTQNYSYWYITEQGSGSYTIRNAATGQYIIYDGVRMDIDSDEELRRYISMSDQANGNEALWTINYVADGIYAFRNVAYPNHLWDVRTDSYCVGTYSRTDSPNNNQRFYIYDQNGNIVTEKVPDIEPTEEGFNVSSWFKGNPETMEGWNVSGGWFQNNGDGGSHYNYDDGSKLVKPFIENWHSSNQGPLENCSLTQTLDYLPAGDYTLQADMMAVRQAYNSYWGNQDVEPGQGVTLYANNSTTNVSTYDDPPQRFTVDFSLSTTGTVDLGVRAVNTNANWIAIDNVILYYKGSREQLIEGEKYKVRTELADYYTSDQIEEMMGEAGDNFDALETLRKSVSNLPSIDPLARAAQGLTIDGHDLNYAESIDLYLCAVPMSTFGKPYTATIEYTPVEGSSNLRINGQEVAPGTQYKFTSVQGSKNYTFSITRADGKTVTKNVTFTALPVVKLYGSFNDEYSNGMIYVTDTDGLSGLMNMKAKWRGGITNGSGKHKRNYHVKLHDENGDKLEAKIFGMRKDNSWILESCQVDMSRIRNRVLTDLWNDYSTKPYYFSQEPKAMTGTHGKFVELILNDEYRGIYCFTENIDRKQMKLKKIDEETGTVHGQLWKSKDWTYATMMGTSPDGGYQPKYYLTDPNENSEMWDKYEVKYPDFEDYGYQTDWSTLYEAVDFVCHSSDDYFINHVAEYFDVPVLIDYYILQETILSTDNHGKNMFFGVYDKQTDKKITFSVWDMDATCGQRWSDDYYHRTDIMNPEYDYAWFISNYEHGDYNLFKRMRDTDAENFNLKVRERYRDLRGSYLSTASILQRFSNYLGDFKACGADKREYNKWNGDSDISRLNLDFDNEMEYLTDWFTRRMNYLDTERFDIASLPTDIADMKRDSQSQTVYSLSGIQVGTVSEFGKLPSGIYIIGGRKVVKE